MENRFGLSRNIPAEIKRQVRKACGFGCVICGLGIIDYEHIDPPFSEANKHSVDGITLLCPRCHAKATRGFLSKEKIKKSIKEPYCLIFGCTRESFDLGKNHPKIVFCGVTLTNCQVPIMIMGMPLFEIKEAEEIGGPFRLSAFFTNSIGELSLIIIDNEWKAYSLSNWDIEVGGGIITIRDNKGHISLRLVTIPPDKIIIKNLDMSLFGYRFIGNDNVIVVETPEGGRINMSGWMISDCRVGISFS